MKKILLFVFFLLFIALIFIWDHELTSFWMDPSNTNFLMNELVMRLSPYAYILDFLHAYRYPILALGLMLFAYSYYKKKREEYKERMRINPFTGAKVIYDANKILSKDSLPESEKRREKARKDGPALIPKTKTEKKIPEPPQEDDIDTEKMREMLDLK